MVEISVIMGVYNEKREWIDQAIASILQQTFTEFEFIIIMDNPENFELYNYLLDKAKLDDRIVILRNETNLGLPNTLNRGISVAKGKYIARMDADDIAFSKRFELQLEKFAANKKLALVGGRIDYIDEKSKFIDNDKYRATNIAEIRKNLRVGNIFAHPTMMMKKAVLTEIGGYKNIKYAEDYELVINMIKNGYEVCNINKVLVEYRVRGNSISNSNRGKQFIATQCLVKLYEGREFDDFEAFFESEVHNVELEKIVLEYLNALDAIKNGEKTNIFILIKLFLKHRYIREIILRKIKNR